MFLQEEIKIIEVEVYVNPYTELDEEEEEKNNKEEKVEDEEHVSSAFILGYFSFQYFVISLMTYCFSRTRLVHGIAIQGQEHQKVKQQTVVSEST